ncbi:MAG: hypothetical protein AAB837_01760 [Patescibacteria group bacterium]
MARRPTRHASQGDVGGGRGNFVLTKTKLSVTTSGTNGQVVKWQTHQL